MASIDELMYSRPVSVVMQAADGADLLDVECECLWMANRLRCDVVFMVQGRVHVVRPTDLERE
jgi:hypothetical protein